MKILAKSNTSWELKLHILSKVTIYLRGNLYDIPEELLGSCHVDTPMHPNNVLRDDGDMARPSQV